MNVLWLCGGGLLAWCFLSQLIAWMLVGVPDEDRVVEMWVCVWFAPVMGAMVAVAFFEQWLRRVAYYFRYGEKPSDNPMDYLL